MMKIEDENGVRDFISLTPFASRLLGLTLHDSRLNQRNGILNRNACCIAVVSNDQTELFLHVFRPACFNKLCNRVRSGSVSSGVESVKQIANNSSLITHLGDFHKLTQSFRACFRQTLVESLPRNYLRITSPSLTNVNTSSLSSSRSICHVSFCLLRLDCKFLFRLRFVSHVVLLRVAVGLFRQENCLTERFVCQEVN